MVQIVQMGNTSKATTASRPAGLIWQSITQYPQRSGISAAAQNRGHRWLDWLRIWLSKTSHSVAFYRCPNTLSAIWSTDAHVVAGAEMKKKWAPMHVRSPVLQTLKNIIPRSPLPPRPLRRCVTGSTSTVKHRCPRCENWRAKASVLCVRLKFFLAPLTLWTVWAIVRRWFFSTGNAVASLTFLSCCHVYK